MNNMIGTIPDIEVSLNQNNNRQNGQKAVFARVVLADMEYNDKQYKTAHGEYGGDIPVWKIGQKGAIKNKQKTENKKKNKNCFYRFSQRNLLI